MLDDGEDVGEEIMEEADDEDLVAKSEPQFKTWNASLLAQTNCMRVLLKLADYLDTSKLDVSGEDEDEEFEDCEEDEDDGAMQDEEQKQPAQVIDMDV